MVSPCTGQEDAPVDPWKGLSDSAGDVDGWSSLLSCQQPCDHTGVKFSMYKAAWINPGYAQQELPASPTLVPTVENRRSSSLPLSPLGNPTADTPASEDTVNPTGSPSALGAGEKCSESPVTSVEEQLECPPHGLQVPVSRSLAAYPRPGTSCASPQRPRQTGAGHVGGRSTSLNSFSLEAFLLPVDIEKENAHFYVADMLIATMEKVKYNFLSEQRPENRKLEKTSEFLKNEQADPEVAFPASVKQDSGSSASADSGFEELENVHSAREPCGRAYSSSQSVASASSFNSPERVAAELYRGFHQRCVLAAVSSQLPAAPATPDSAVVNREHEQEDLAAGAPAGQEVGPRPRGRDTEDWLPPRFQIIIRVHPPLRRDLMLVAQDFLCAGCGTPVEPKSVKRLRYCEYLGKYFCHGCHSATTACIPARILTSWDFRKYHVSDFSRRLLDSIWHQPVFDLRSVGRGLAGKVRELDRVKEIQEQLFHIKKLLKTCRFAESTLQVFEQVPGHLTDKCHLFSLDDLVRIKKGLLASPLKDMLKASLDHVARCELCQGKGFICEFCRNPAVIFPFQTATCRRCSACRACFHKQCFRATQCPRCMRNTARRKLLENVPPAAT